MITRLVKMTFRPDEVEQFKTIFNESKDLIRRFPGNHHVELLQDEKDASVFFTLSFWENEEALEAYRHSELFRDTWSRTKALFRERAEAWSTRRQAEGQTAS